MLDWFDPLQFFVVVVVSLLILYHLFPIVGLPPLDGLDVVTVMVINLIMQFILRTPKKEKS